MATDRKTTYCEGRMDNEQISQVSYEKIIFSRVRR